MLKSKCVESKPVFFSCLASFLQVLQTRLLLRSVTVCDPHAWVSKALLAQRALLRNDRSCAGALGMRRIVWGRGYHSVTRKTCIQLLVEQSQTSFLRLNHFIWHVLQFPICAGWIMFLPTSNEYSRLNLCRSWVFWYHRDEDKDQWDTDP